MQEASVQYLVAGVPEVLLEALPGLSHQVVVRNFNVVPLMLREYFRAVADTVEA